MVDKSKWKGSQRVWWFVLWRKDSVKFCRPPKK